MWICIKVYMWGWWCTCLCLYILDFAYAYVYMGIIIVYICYVQCSCYSILTINVFSLSLAYLLLSSSPSPLTCHPCFHFEGVYQVVQLHWNGNVIILTKFSSLAALKVVILTTFGAASDENFIKMMTFSFQCNCSWPILNFHFQFKHGKYYGDFDITFE